MATLYRPSSKPKIPLEAVILGLNVSSKKDIMKCIEIGFPKKALTKVLVFLDLQSPNRIAGHLQVSLRTLQRAEDHLSPAVSNNLYQLTTLLARAKELFNDDQQAKTFLQRPNPALGGETPLDYSRTAIGLQVVLDLIGGLEQGIIQ
jgi:putative toxin-antitoxin system antitoxin component (TIGR02293 family)